MPESLLKQHLQWIKVVNEGNMDAYADLMTDQGVWIPPGQAPIIGRDNFKAWLTPFMKNYSYEFSIDDVRINMSKGWAFEKGRFNSKMTNLKSQETMEHSGTFCLLWKQESDGNWYIDRYIDDTNLK